MEIMMLKSPAAPSIPDYWTLVLLVPPQLPWPRQAITDYSHLFFGRQLTSHNKIRRLWVLHVQLHWSEKVAKQANLDWFTIKQQEKIYPIMKFSEDTNENVTSMSFKKY